MPLARARALFFPPLFKLIDASLQVAGLGTGPVGVTGTLLRAHRGSRHRLWGSVSLPDGHRSLTSAHAGVGGIHRKVIVSPAARQQNSWVGVVLQVWASQLCPAGWFVTSALHSLPCTHARPRNHVRETSETRPAPGCSSAAAAVRTPLGTCWKRRRPKLFFEVFEARPLLASAAAASAVPGRRRGWVCGSGSPPFSAHRPVPQSVPTTLSRFPGVAR